MGRAGKQPFVKAGEKSKAHRGRPAARHEALAETPTRGTPRLPRPEPSPRGGLTARAARGGRERPLEARKWTEAGTRPPAWALRGRLGPGFARRAPGPVRVGRARGGRSRGASRAGVAGRRAEAPPPVLPSPGVPPAAPRGGEGAARASRLPFCAAAAISRGGEGAGRARARAGRAAASPLFLACGSPARTPRSRAPASTSAPRPVRPLQVGVLSAP